MIPKSNPVLRSKTHFLVSVMWKSPLYLRKCSSSSIKIWRISVKNSTQAYSRNKTYHQMPQSQSTSLTIIMAVRTNLNLCARIPRLLLPLMSPWTRALPHYLHRSVEMQRERSSRLTCLGSSIAWRQRIYLPKPVVPVAVALQQVVGAHPQSRAQNQEYSRKPENLPANIMESLFKSTLAYARARMHWNSIALISTPSSSQWRTFLLTLGVPSVKNSMKSAHKQLTKTGYAS